LSEKVGKLSENCRKIVGKKSIENWNGIESWIGMGKNGFKVEFVWAIGRVGV
jgi:hypothetical protein